jgi:hypothetical protein
MIDLIVDTRIAVNRKSSFWYIRAESNAGKSFLSSLLEGISIATEVHYHNLKPNGASDLNPVEVRNSMVMIIDEFKVFTQDMKKLSHKISISPKFGLREEVPLYLKILFSAERSESFYGSIDAQIKNRVAISDTNRWAKIGLEDREVFQKYGNSLYADILKEYIGVRLKNRFREYFALKDKYLAINLADKRVKEFYKSHTINTKDLTLSIQETVRDFIESQSHQNILYITSGKNKGKHLIKSPRKTIEEILKNSLDEGEFKKAKFKLPMIDEILKGKKTAIYLLGKTHKGLLIDKEVLYSSFVEVEEIDIKSNQSIISYIEKSA